MAFRLKQSYFAAIVVLIIIGVWMGTGEINIGGQANTDQIDPDSNVSTTSDSETNNEKPFAVRVVTLAAEPRQRSLEVRGRTEANALISVRSETSGLVAERFVSLGETVENGQLLCRLEIGARQARLLQEQAAVSQAQADYNASKTLEQKGFIASNTATAARAALDAAHARLQEAELELARIEIKAPVSGIIQDPLTNIGDLLSPGSVCATIIDTDPILMTGQVSERDIGNLSVGMVAQIDLMTGQSQEGKITYISPSADSATRTFRIDIEIENKKYGIRDGVTAVAYISLSPVKTHKLAPSMLTLNDEGKLGVRVVDMETYRNSFQAVTILRETPQGIWVNGLPETVTIIAVGQDYVIDGQIVEPVFTDAKS